MLKRHTIPHRLTVDFSPDGKTAHFNLCFHTGAYDTGDKAWVGRPEPVNSEGTTETPEGRKLLNDFLGLSFTALMERCRETGARAFAAENARVEAVTETEALRIERDQALKLAEQFRKSAEEQEKLKRTAVNESGVFQRAWRSAGLERDARRSLRSRLTFGLWTPKVSTLTD